MSSMTKPVTIASLSKLKGTTFCEMRLNGNLRRGNPKNKKRPASTIEVSIPEPWVTDLFRCFLKGDGDSEYFLMRVPKSEIPE